MLNHKANNKSLQLLIALLTAGMDFFHLGLVYPIFAEMMVSSDTSLDWAVGSWQRSFMYAILIGAFPFGQCLGSPIIGRLSDTYGRRRLLFITVAGSSCGIAICAIGVLYVLPWMILCGRLLGGLMGANLSLAYAVIADLSQPHEKTKQLALIPLTTSLGFLLGPLMVGILENETRNWILGASLPLWIASLLSLMNWGLLWLFDDSAPNCTLHPLKKSSFLLRQRKLWLPLCIAFLMISANFLLVQYVGPYSINQLDSDLTTVSWLYVNLSLSVAIGHLVLTRHLASIISPQTALPWSLAALACALVAVSQSVSVMELHITLSIAMLCCAVAYTNVFAYLSNQVGSDQQGEIMGLGVAVQCFAEWIPPLIVGMFALSYPTLPMLVGAMACAAGLTGFWMGSRLLNRNEEGETFMINPIIKEKG